MTADERAKHEVNFVRICHAEGNCADPSRAKEIFTGSVPLVNAATIASSHGLWESGYQEDSMFQDISAIEFHQKYGMGLEDILEEEENVGFARLRIKNTKHSFGTGSYTSMDSKEHKI